MSFKRKAKNFSKKLFSGIGSIVAIPVIGAIGLSLAIPGVNKVVEKTINGVTKTYNFARKKNSPRLFEKRINKLRSLIKERSEIISKKKNEELNKKLENINLDIFDQCKKILYHLNKTDYSLEEVDNGIKKKYEKTLEMNSFLRDCYNNIISFVIISKSLTLKQFNELIKSVHEYEKKENLSYNEKNNYFVKKANDIVKTPSLLSPNVASVLNKYLSKDRMDFYRLPKEAELNKDYKDKNKKDNDLLKDFLNFFLIHFKEFFEVKIAYDSLLTKRIFIAYGSEASFSESLWNKVFQDLSYFNCWLTRLFNYDFYPIKISPLKSLLRKESESVRAGCSREPTDTNFRFLIEELKKNPSENLVNLFLNYSLDLENFLEEKLEGLKKRLTEVKDELMLYDVKDLEKSYDLLYEYYSLSWNIGHSKSTQHDSKRKIVDVKKNVKNKGLWKEPIISCSIHDKYNHSTNSGTLAFKASCSIDFVNRFNEAMYLNSNKQVLEGMIKFSEALIKLVKKDIDFCKKNLSKESFDLIEKEHHKKNKIIKKQKEPSKEKTEEIKQVTLYDICPHCGHRNKKGYIYCANCGFKKADKTKECPECFMANKNDAKFCRKCGYKF